MTSKKLVWDRVVGLKPFVMLCMVDLLCSSCVFTKVLYQPLLYLSLMYGLVVLVDRFFLRRSIVWDRFAKLLFLFCVSYGVTILLNYRSNLVNNGGQLIYTAFYFFVFFCGTAALSVEERTTLLLRVCRLITVFSLVVALVSLGMLFTFYSRDIVFAGTEVHLGISLRGGSKIQLDGIASSCSALASLCLLGLFSVILRHILLGKRWSVGSALCLLIYAAGISGANEFAGVIMVMAFVAFAVLAETAAGLTDKTRSAAIKRVFCGILMAGVLCIGVFSIYRGIQYIESWSINAFSAISESSSVEPAPTIVREVATSATGVRSQLWMAGLKLLMQHPLGVTNSNIEVKIFYGVPDYPYYNLHNGYITLLVGAGIIGFVLIIWFGLSLLGSLFRFLLRSHDKAVNRELIVLSAAAAAILAGDLVNGCFVLWRDPAYALLWLLLGSIAGILASHAAKSQESEPTEHDGIANIQKTVQNAE